MNHENKDTDASTLYHYTNANALVGIIKNREVWATGSNYLNDPTEVSYAANALVDEMEQALQYCDHKEQVESALTLLKTSFVDPNPTAQYHEDRTFVSSFSRSDQSLNLWRLYSGRNGFCVGFDQSELLSWVGQEYPSSTSESFDVDEGEKNAALITKSVIHKCLPAESVKFEAGDGANEVGKFCKTSAIAGLEDFPVLPVRDASFDRRTDGGDVSVGCTCVVIMLSVVKFFPGSDCGGSDVRWVRYPLGIIENRFPSTQADGRSVVPSAGGRIGHAKQVTVHVRGNLHVQPLTV